MDIEVREEPIAALAEHAGISIAFTVDRVLGVTISKGGLGGLVLSERAVDEPYVKDYDAIDGEGPTRWATRFDVSKWGLIGAYSGGRRVGGAVVAFDTAGVALLEARPDVAVLWDIRVRAEHRGQGVGSVLFQATEAWAAARGCRWLKVETQNINVAACRFYARHGCVLGAINRFAYAALPDEVQMLWYKDLDPQAP
jgi:GNAT superfamily N-acetyltransferase